jgi:hypothetical protein
MLPLVVCPQVDKVTRTQPSRHTKFFTAASPSNQKFYLVFHIPIWKFILELGARLAL